MGPESVDLTNFFDGSHEALEFLTTCWRRSEARRHGGVELGQHLVTMKPEHFHERLLLGREGGHGAGELGDEPLELGNEGKIQSRRIDHGVIIPWLVVVTWAG